MRNVELPDQLADGSRILHIGLPKTGTTALQASFDAHRDELAHAGVLYVSRSRNPLATARYAAGTSTRSDEGRLQRRWNRLAREFRDSSARATVLSSEGFSGADPQHVRSIAAAVGTDTTVVITLRAIADLYPSRWQQAVRRGLTDPFDVWLSKVLAPGHPYGSRMARHDPEAILRSWGAQFGEGNLVFICPDPADRRINHRSFEALLGINGILQPEPVVNASPPYDAVEMMRHLNRAGSEDEDQELWTRIRRQLGRRMGDSPPPDLSREPLRLPKDAVARFNDAARFSIADLRGSGATVVGDLDHLLVDPNDYPEQLPTATTIDIHTAGWFAHAVGEMVLKETAHGARPAPADTDTLDRPVLEPGADMRKIYTSSSTPGPAKRASPSLGGLITAPRVFYPAAGLLAVFVALTAAFPKRVGDVIGDLNTSVVQDLGWWYVAVVSGFVFFAIWIACSHLGNVVLGKDDEEPEFGLGSWFAMLFAAGMGIGLVFWGVAEPLNHYSSPPPGASADTTPQAARSAMDTTFLHWGLHAWAIYVVVGLAIAYSVHRRGNPISLRWALEPLLGDRIKGFWGDVIDVIAILGTLFGVATSLGLGVSQIGAGLAYLDVIDEPSTWLLIALVIVITAIALTSVVTGVDKGIKWLSNLNMAVAVSLVAVVLVLGPTVFILSDFVTQIGSYVENFFQLSFNARPFQEDGKAWLGGWTTFYWGWWMSWAPFVGVFIARISRGRTVREFVVGVLLVPTLVTFLWFAVMGGTALYDEVFGDQSLIDPDAGVSTNTALFQMLDLLPGSAILSVVALALIVVFFVTSSDSGSYVVDMIASGGDPNPPRWSRAFWASLEGLVAAVLLYVGLHAQQTDPSVNPLGALQTMAILLALPFSVVMILMAAATAKSLMREERQRRQLQREWLAKELVEELERQRD